ncbi:MAG: hypothetical protein ACREPI_09130 [Candidatus Dormibacterales bacterium]
MVQTPATGDERVDTTDRIESMYTAAHQAWVTAMGAWSAAHENAVAGPGARDTWTLEERAWAACRSMATCRELAWKVWEAEVASARQRAIDAALPRGDLHLQAVEDGVKRAIERRTAVPPQAAPESQRPPRPVMDFNPPAPPVFASVTVPADFGTPPAAEPSVYDTQPAAPAVVEVPSFSLTQGDGASPVVRRLQALLEDQAIVRPA